MISLWKIIAAYVVFMFLVGAALTFGVIKTGEYVVSHGGVKAVVSTLWNGTK